MDDRFEIRDATHDDVPQLLPLMRSYCEFYEVGPEQAPDAGLEVMARTLIDSPDDQGFMLSAVEGERVVGFAACIWKWSSLRASRIVVLEDLFVHPDARGTGVADELIGRCGEIAKSNGAPVLAWYTQVSNKRAQKVYDRVGGHPDPLIEYEIEL